MRATLPMMVAPEVSQALDAGQPVVALESTVIAHGLPAPDNIRTARAMEDLIRREGATPATIAILDGVIRVGLTPDDLETLTTANPVYKASRQDIPVLVAQGWTGATTVAATMVIARRVGIRVFATGGIGGVHRDVLESFDISADLQELGRTDVAVVCSGVKSILDIDWTLEYLETLGVTVLGYGTDDFPAFYCAESGCPVEYRLDDATQIARVMAAKWELGIAGAVLVANPVPAAQGLAFPWMEQVVGEALEEAARRGVRGKAVTPFLLETVKEKTDGQSLQANMALLESNAVLAARVAKAYAAEQSCATGTSQ